MNSDTQELRRQLVAHAVRCNRSYGDLTGTEDAFADVIADLAMDRPIRDRELFVRFLWQRVSLAVASGVSPEAHMAWAAAVELLDRLGQDLADIFTGRPAEAMLEARWGGPER